MQEILAELSKIPRDVRGLLLSLLAAINSLAIIPTFLPGLAVLLSNWRNLCRVLWTKAFGFLQIEVTKEEAVLITLIVLLLGTIGRSVLLGYKNLFQFRLAGSRASYVLLGLAFAVTFGLMLFANSTIMGNRDYLKACADAIADCAKASPPGVVNGEEQSMLYDYLLILSFVVSLAVSIYPRAVITLTVCVLALLGLNAVLPSLTAIWDELVRDVATQRMGWL